MAGTRELQGERGSSLSPRWYHPGRGTDSGSTTAAKEDLNWAVECNLPRGDFQLFSMEIEKHMGFITSPSHLKHILVLGLPQDLSPIFAHLSECVTVVIDFKTHGNPQAPSHLSADFNYTLHAALFPEALRRWELFFELPQGGRVRKCYSF